MLQTKVYYVEINTGKYSLPFNDWRELVICLGVGSNIEITMELFSSSL